MSLYNSNFTDDLYSLAFTNENNVYAAGFCEVKFDGRDIPSGIYFYTIVSGDFSETKKMLTVNC